MTPGDQIKLLVDVSRGLERFKKGDILTLKRFVGDNPEPLWAVEETNVGFYETEMLNKGDRVIVKSGDNQGLIGIIKTWNKKGQLTILAEANNVPFYSSFENTRVWTAKDYDINFKFQKLLALMNMNKTTLEARKKENFTKALIDRHIDNMKDVKSFHERFLYHEKFSKTDIKTLNKIWKIENESKIFYVNPKWVYDGNIPTGYKPKYTEIEYRTLLRSYQPSAHAVMYGPTS